MIKVVIFDADGVLVFGDRKFSDTLAEKHGIPLEKTHPFFTGPFQKCLVGDLDLKKVIKPYLKKWGLESDLDEFLDYWFSLESKTDKELIKYIQELRKNGILCFLATNNEKHRFKYIINNMGLSNIFDRTYASAYLGCKKSNKDFFKKIFKDLKNIKKEEVLFIDDGIENIKVAKEFGINAELYTTFESFKEKMKQCL
ncbi:MAG: HAD-IA family hydrolase [Candidatus Paceibacterota bacterium]|jgi:putative hydrolase of the HAD superfamily